MRDSLRYKRILVTGGAGFLGTALVGNLVEKRKVSSGRLVIPRSKDMDLRVWENCLQAVDDADVVIHLAARVGGIGFNRSYPATIFYDNAMMGMQLIEAARIKEVEKFVIVGSVCAYPKMTPIPFSEDDLWSGYPEETNAPYGIAKRVLLVQAQAYRQQYGLNTIYLMPANLYGPGDNFNPESSHVIPALIKKIHDSQLRNDDHIIVWGTGRASREFLYVDDAAEGILKATELYNKPEPVNLGTGMETTIYDLVTMLCEIMEFRGEILWDSSKPDGQPRRCLNTRRAEKEFGFRPEVSIKEGLRRTVRWYRDNPFPS